MRANKRTLLSKPGWLTVLFAVGLLVLSANALEAKLTIKAAHTVATTNSQHTPFARFMEVVKSKSNGKIDVKMFPNAMMGSDNEIMEKVQMGALQMGHASTSNLTNIVLKWGAFELPYIVTQTLDNMKLFYKDGKLGGPIFDELDREMQSKNLKMIWISPASFRGVGANKPGLKLPKDLEGLKIRCTASHVDRDVLKAFGCNPVAMGFGEVYTALQQGTIDGEGLPPDLMYDMKHHEVIKSVVMNKYNVFFLPVSMNLQFYQKLPDWAREIVDEAAVEAVNHANEMWVKMLKEKTAKMIEAGVEIHEPTQQEWEIWKAKVKPAIDKHSERIGSDWVQKVKDTLGVD